MSKSQIKALTNSNLSPEDWLSHYIKANEITYDYKTDSICMKGEVLERQGAVSYLRLSAYNHEVLGLKSYLPDALSVWKREQAQVVLSGLRNQLQFQVSGSCLAAEWIEAVTGKQDKLDVAIFRHFIWQIKRKLYGLPVEHHLMVVLSGKSGSGKSVAVHSLLKPIVAVSACGDMTMFNDQFSKKQFTRNFVIFFDELAKSSRVNIDSLKNVVTAPVVEWRRMRSEGSGSGPQNCTFIGCSNSPLKERIHDPTSARRFWELKCTDKLNWEKINSIDYLKLWQSVDENSECPILPVLKDIELIQNNDIRSVDLIEEWLSQICEQNNFDDRSHTTYELFTMFRNWCDSNGTKNFITFQKFGRDLQSQIRNLGWNVSSKHSNRGTVWPIKLKPVTDKTGESKVSESEDDNGSLKTLSTAAS
jgi:hypothetical protein